MSNTKTPQAEIQYDFTRTALLMGAPLAGLDGPGHEEGGPVPFGASPHIGLLADASDPHVGDQIGLLLAPVEQAQRYLREISDTVNARELGRLEEEIPLKQTTKDLVNAGKQTHPYDNQSLTDTQTQIAVGQRLSYRIIRQPTLMVRTPDSQSLLAGAWESPRPPARCDRHGEGQCYGRSSVREARKHVRLGGWSRTSCAAATGGYPSAPSSPTSPG